jgi:hypothetical protein
MGWNLVRAACSCFMFRISVRLRVSLRLRVIHSPISQLNEVAFGGGGSCAILFCSLASNHRRSGLHVDQGRNSGPNRRHLTPWVCRLNH